MISRLMLVVVSVIIVGLAQAQPDSSWSRTYGGSFHDRFNTIIQTDDGGYVIGGMKQQQNSSDDAFWYLKVDANGNNEWSDILGGGDREECFTVKQTSVGGYVFGGERYTLSNGGYNFFLVKTDANGSNSWTRAYDGGRAESCNSILETVDQGYLMAGTRQYHNGDEKDFWVLKANSAGDSLWSRSYGGLDGEECFSAIQMEDGSLIFAGYTDSYGVGFSDFWLVKTDANGDSIWSHTYGTGSIEQCYTLQQTSDGGFILAGMTSSRGDGEANFWLVKTNADGDSLWSRIFGGSNNDVCYSVQQMSDGGYTLAGYTYSFGDGRWQDFWLLRTDSQGDSLWSRSFGGNDWDRCFALQSTNDGGYILAGETYSFGAGYNDGWLVKTGPDPTTDVSHYFVTLPSDISLSAYPNPFNSELTLDVTGFSRDLRVSLHNLLGQELDVIHSGLVTGTSLHYAAPANLSSGSYFIQATDARNVKTVKVVYLK